MLLFKKNLTHKSGHNFSADNPKKGGHNFNADYKL